MPTLAWMRAWLGEGGQVAAAALLLLGVMAAWWQRLGAEPGGERHRMVAMALLAMGASLGLNRYFFTLHELWSGMLLALAFGLHRPGRRWGAALAVAALALAIREHALPFVLLMAAMALWRRDWKEGAAWSALALGFVAISRISSTTMITSTVSLQILKRCSTCRFRSPPCSAARRWRHWKRIGTTISRVPPLSVPWPKPPAVR